jgi:hypothetical protein
MPGPAPADPSRRRRRNTPARGEWVDLDLLVAPVLGDLPCGDWHPRTRALWDAWRADPVTATWTPADCGAAVELAHLVDLVVRGRSKLAPEMRLRMDGLGLTAKGRRDLRLRTPSEPTRDPSVAPVYDFGAFVAARVGDGA